jgi:hypothetical protein
VPESLEEFRIALEGDGRIDQRPQIEIRFEAAFAHHRGASRQHRGLGGVAADGSDEREPVERLMQGNA